MIEKNTPICVTRSKLNTICVLEWWYIYILIINLDNSIYIYIHIPKYIYICLHDRCPTAQTRQMPRKRQNLEPSWAPVPSLCMTTPSHRARPVTSLWVAVHTSRVVKSMLRWQGSWGGWQLEFCTGWWWILIWMIWLVHFQCENIPFLICCPCFQTSNWLYHVWFSDLVANLAVKNWFSTRR